MQPYQKFLISNSRTGFDEALEPWLLPGDAYQSILNAHLYRGVLEKIQGYELFAPFSYRNVLALTGSGKTYTGTLPTTPTTTNFYGYGTLVEGSTAETFKYDSDASATVIDLNGNQGGTGTVDLTPGPTYLNVTLNFNTAPPASEYTSVFFIWDSAPLAVTAIMGIKPYFKPDSTQDIIVFDQKRVGKIVNNFGVLSATAKANQGISELPHAYYQSAVFTGDGATSTFVSSGGGANASPLHANIVPSTVTFFLYDNNNNPQIALDVDGLNSQESAIDNGQGMLKSNLLQWPAGTLITVSAGKINYSDGNYTITFSSPLPSGWYFNASAGIYGDLFTGSISNFFTVANFQYYLFFTNNVDPIFYYDGDLVQYLITNLSVKAITSSSGKPTVDITRCLHLTVNRDRLLLMRPTINGISTATTQVSTIFWSKAFQPLIWSNDEFEYAPTSESIIAFGYINSDLIVRFSNSSRKFTYTGSDLITFRWDTINSLWACDAPYSSINYDKRFTTVGKPAIVADDGVNVKRADEQIPDFTDPSRIPQQLGVPLVPFMSQTSIQQCYGQRFDDLKEGWLCYNSAPEAETGATASDNILAFNYLDDTYAIYDFPFSCLGLGQILTAQTWGTTYSTWGEDADTWGDWDVQNSGLLDLGGDQFDRVYQLNTSNSCTVAGDDTTTPVPVLMDVFSKNFNPFLEDGQLCRFGYIDLFVSANADTTLRVQFYVNDNLYVDGTGTPQGWYKEEILTFRPKDAMSPQINQVKVWKRIYVGAVGKTHTIRFYQNIDDFGTDEEPLWDQPVYIHGICLYMKPAGRVFN